MTAMQQHLRVCVNAGRQLRVLLQRLPKDHLLAIEVLVASQIPQTDEQEIHECKLCGEIYFQAEVLQEHVKSHATLVPDLIMCSFKKCHRVFTSPDELKEHRQDYHSQVLRIACEICNDTFEDALLLSKHLKSHPQVMYSQNFLTTNKKIVINRSILYTCLKCRMTFKNHISYKVHLVQKHDTETPAAVKCLYSKCKQLFDSVNDLKKHTMEEHDNIKRFECKPCLCFFQTGKKLQEHKIKIHGHSLFKYISCSMSFKDKDSYDVHNFETHNVPPSVSKSHEIVSATMQQMGECDVPNCFFRSQSNQSLQVHKINMHSIWPTTCHLCGKGYFSDTHLKQHVQAHKTDVQGVIKCLHGNCKATFAVQTDLRMHMSQHMSQCNVPGCTFASKSYRDIYMHKTSLHAIWPHYCRLCGNGFHNSVNLQQHMTSHENEDREVIKCNFAGCKQTFDSETELEKHAAKHRDFWRLSQLIKKQQENQNS